MSDISFQVRSGETLGLVGESGSGKSTILRAIAGLAPDHSGKIRLNDIDLPFAVARRDLPTLRNIQLIFQNPDSALNPRRTIAEILEAPLRRYTDLQGRDLTQRCCALLDSVRLPESYLDRLPAQLSGGEKQRVGIARAFAVTPDLVLCDEITSALDVSVQAAVLRLLKELQGQSGAAYVLSSKHWMCQTSCYPRPAALSNAAARGMSARFAMRKCHPFNNWRLIMLPHATCRCEETDKS